MSLVRWRLNSKIRRGQIEANVVDFVLKKNGLIDDLCAIQIYLRFIIVYSVIVHRHKMMGQRGIFIQYI